MQVISDCTYGINILFTIIHCIKKKHVLQTRHVSYWEKLKSSFPYEINISNTFREVFQMVSLLKITFLKIWYLCLLHGLQYNKINNKYVDMLLHYKETHLDNNGGTGINKVTSTNCRQQLKLELKCQHLYAFIF